MREPSLQTPPVSEDSSTSTDSVPVLSEGTDEKGQEEIERTRIRIIDVMDYGH